MSSKLFAHYRDVYHMKNVCGNEDEEDSTTVTESYMVVRGSLKSELPSTLIINSANLKVQDPIGQGLLK